MIKLKKYFGPSTLVTAAFIGPGTITTCTIVGVEKGYSLLWVIGFAIITTVVLQEMSARLGFATQEGLGEALNKQFSTGIGRWLVFFLTVSAILIGNAAYESGNLSGGILGLELLFGENKLFPLFLGLPCFMFMYFGDYKKIERLLITLVILMCVCFIVTAILVKPNIIEIFKGLVPDTDVINTDYLLIMAIIGTTVVPYNLFLHASAVSKKWQKTNSLRDLRIENFVAIVLGGITSAMIIITSASSKEFVGIVQSSKDLAIQLEPVFGKLAKQLLGVGLLAAGITSAITAPLAAAYATKGLFGWSANEKDNKFRAVWMLILIIGVIVSITEINKIVIIKFAQIANALILPFVAIYLLYISNSKRIMSKYTNKIISNILGVFVIFITCLLSIKSLMTIF